MNMFFFRFKFPSSIIYYLSLTLLIVMIFLFAGVGVARAAPSIISWNSTGGTTQNKDNDQDIMYLVQQGDVITFYATSNESADFIWEVNKVEKSTTTSVTSDSFNFTVPNEKSIWEIHLKVLNAGGEAHHEWIVSTLSVGEAPEISESFADGKLNGTRTDSDPWGRALPLWTVESGGMNASDRYVVETSLGLGNHANFSVPTNIVKGTWIFKYKYIKGTPSFTGGNYMLEITAQYNNPTGIGTGYSAVYKGLSLKNPVDGHWWIDYPYSNKLTRNGYIVNMAGSQIDKSLVGGNTWHEVVFIKDQNDYFYTWLDGKFVRWSTDKIHDITDSTKFFFDFYDGLYSLAYPIAIDDIRIYRDQYFPPVSSITYNSASGSITIKGFGATLDKIAAAINDPVIFSYDPLTNTAIAYKDILIDRGSELRIENGTLQMDSSYDGERKINYYTDAIFNIYNSTITSTNDYYFLWQRLSDGDANLKNTFRVINSTINNSGGIFLERPVAIYIENSNFTNLVGNHPIQMYFRWPPRELTIKNSIFTGKTGAEIVYISGGDQFGKLSPKPVGMDIIDSDFSQVVFERRQDSPYYLSPGSPGGTANIINTKLNSVNYSGTTLRYKYYLDVKVVDTSGNLIQGANVIVTNEIDDVNYPNENLLEGKEYFQLINQKAPDGSPYFSGQTSNWIKGFTDVNNHSSAITGVDGHTPLPSDIANTLVITNKESRDSGNTLFTYKITASKDGKTASMSGLDVDDTWYREDPNTPTKTVVCNVDTGVCYVEGVGGFEESVGEGGGGGGGGCLIATASFGSPLAKEVEILREFRDKYLLTNNLGKALVRAYYKHSPKLANYIKDKESLKAIVRLCLRPIIFFVKGL